MPDGGVTTPRNATSREIAEDEGGFPTPDIGKGGMNLGGGGLVQTVLVALVVFAVGILFLSATNTLVVGKSAFDKNLGNISTTIGEMKTQQMTFATKTDLNGYVATPSLADYARKSELANYATKDQLSIYATIQALSDANAKFEGYVKKVDYDAAIARLKTLEDKVATMTAGVGTGTTTGGEVTFTVAGAPTSPIYASGTYSYLLSVTNNSGLAKKVYIQAIASLMSQPSAPPSPNVTVAGTSYIAGATSGWTGATTFSMTFSPAPVAGVSTACFRIAGMSDGYVLMASGQTILVPVTFNLVATTTGAIWQVTFTPLATAF